MKRNVFLTALLAISLLLVAVGSLSAQDDEFVFGMVLVGPQDDRGWSQAHYEGGLAVDGFRKPQRR
jgi:simple sugar transport system substrate-binding protein